MSNDAEDKPMDLEAMRARADAALQQSMDTERNVWDMKNRMRAFTPIQEAINQMVEEWVESYVRGGAELRASNERAAKYGWDPPKPLDEDRIKSRIYHHCEYISIYWRVENWRAEHKIWVYKDNRDNGMLEKAHYDEMIAMLEQRLDPVNHIYGMKLKDFWCINGPQMDSDWIQQAHRLAADSPHFKWFDPETCEFVLDLTPPDIAAAVEADRQRRIEKVRQSRAGGGRG